MTKYSSLGLYLKQKRLLAHLSQGEVSVILGYDSPQFVSNWERGLCAPPYPVLYKLIKLYKLQPRLIYKYMLQDSARVLRAELEKNQIKFRK